MIPQKVKIPGWPYWISIEGKVYREKTDRTLREKPLTPVRRREGWTVSLSMDHGTRKIHARLANLMRQCYFGGTPLPLHHKNGMSSDFAYWNLQPMTQSELMRRVRPERENAKTVIRTDADGSERLYSSISQAAKENGISDSTLRRWLTGATPMRVADRDMQFRTENA